MALNQRQQLGSQVQRVENSVWAKYMGGPRGHKSVWARAHSPHGSGTYGYLHIKFDVKTKSNPFKFQADFPIRLPPKLN